MGSLRPLADPCNKVTIDVKAVLSEDEEFLRALVRTALQEVLETEMTEALGAEKGEGAAGRQGYRSGYYGRTLITRVGKLEVRVPQDRTGRFSTAPARSCASTSRMVSRSRPWAAVRSTLSAMSAAISPIRRR